MPSPLLSLGGNGLRLSVVQVAEHIDDAGDVTNVDATVVVQVGIVDKQCRGVAREHGVDEQGDVSNGDVAVAIGITGTGAAVLTHADDIQERLVPGVACFVQF